MGLSARFFWNNNVDNVDLKGEIKIFNLKSRCNYFGLVNEKMYILLANNEGLRNFFY